MPRDTQVSQRVLPWLGLGTLVEGLMTAEECIRAAGLDWTVRLEPLYFKTKRGGEVAVEDRFAVVRTDNSVLGTVGSHYVPFQNTEAFEFFDHLIESGEAKYEAAGSIRDGKQIFICAMLPKNLKFAGDEHQVQLLLRTSHDGTRAIGVYVAMIRTRCTNALTMTVRGAKHSWSVPHVSTVSEKLAEAREALKLTGAYTKNFKDRVDALAKSRLSDRQFKSVLEETLPDRPRTESVREGIIALRRESPNIDDAQRNTAWGGYNAVTEFYDWHRSVRSHEGLMVSMLDGSNSRVRNRVFQRLARAA